MKNVIEELEARKNGMFVRDVTPNDVVGMIEKLNGSERAVAMVHAMVMRNAVLNEVISVVEALTRRTIQVTKDEVEIALVAFECLFSELPEYYSIVEKFRELEALDEPEVSTERKSGE